MNYPSIIDLGSERDVVHNRHYWPYHVLRSIKRQTKKWNSLITLEQKQVIENCRLQELTSMYGCNHHPTACHPITPPEKVCSIWSQIKGLGRYTRPAGKDKTGIWYRWPIEISLPRHMGQSPRKRRGGCDITCRQSHLFLCFENHGGQRSNGNWRRSQGGTVFPSAGETRPRSANQTIGYTERCSWCTEGEQRRYYTTL